MRHGTMYSEIKSPCQQAVVRVATETGVQVITLNLNSQFITGEFPRVPPKRDYKRATRRSSKPSSTRHCSHRKQKPPPTSRQPECYRNGRNRQRRNYSTNHHKNRSRTNRPTCLSVQVPIPEQVPFF